jgi:hypothetical protein
MWTQKASATNVAVIHYCSIIYGVSCSGHALIDPHGHAARQGVMRNWLPANTLAKRCRALQAVWTQKPESATNFAVYCSALFMV